MGNHSPTDDECGSRAAERASRAAIIAAFAHSLALTQFERDDVMATVVTELSLALDDAAVLFLLTDDRERFEVAAVHHPVPEAEDMIRGIFEEVPHMAGGGLLGPVLASRETLFLSDVPDVFLRSAYDQPQHHRYFDTYGLHSLIIVPMTAHGTDIGALAVARSAPDNPYTSADVSFVTDMVERAALALHTANTLRDERRSAALLRAIVDTAIDAIVIIDNAGVIRTVNPATCQLFGYTVDELVGSTIGLLMPEPHRARHPEYIDRYIATREPRIIGIGREVLGRRRDGTTMPMDLAVSEVDLGHEHLFAGIMRDITARKRTEAELARLAETDPLTGLANRSKVLRNLDRFVDRDGAPATAIVFVDLDGFKTINDRFGHDAGDAVLGAVAARIESVARSSDLVGRYGGDEFAILVPGTENVGEIASGIAQRVLDVLAEPVSVHGREFAVTASIGIAVYPDDAGTGASLLRRADAAMYEAKRSQPGSLLRATYAQRK